MLEQLSIDVDEYIYGLGRAVHAFCENGQIVEMWNEDRRNGQRDRIQEHPLLCYK